MNSKLLVEMPEFSLTPSALRHGSYFNYFAIVESEKGKTPNGIVRFKTRNSQSDKVQNLEFEIANC